MHCNLTRRGLTPTLSPNKTFLCKSLALSSDLRGKTAVVLGASSGIGAAVARRFKELGARVIVHHNAHEAAASCVAEPICAIGGVAELAGGDVARPMIENSVGAYGFLASERMSCYIPGQVVEVNGGQLMP
jgi:hypothetical protein